MHASRTDLILDTLFAGFVACILFAFLSLTGGCAHPSADLGKVPRGQFSRTMHVGGQTCRAWIPLIVRSEIGQGYLAVALQAAQPWSESIKFAVAVPALEDEQATVELVVDTCPAEYVIPTVPYCKRYAQTSGRCDGGVYRQTVQLFVIGDAVQVFMTLMHELGHLLGVDGGEASGHSPDTASIMFYQIDPPAPAAKRAAPGQWVRDADAAALRKTWGLQ